MTKYFETRQTLKTLLKSHNHLASDLKINSSIISDVITNLDYGELSVAVVGEVNRGKSTFLNALLGTELFPSRASVCTAGVTILDYGDEPRAEIVLKNGKTKSIKLPIDNPANSLIEVVSRKNKNIQDIKVVRLWYPNSFTGNGLVLVDTPGVNDPETWREDITYEYLAGADAVIMLLDPMQPLSASEVEFLEHKILGRSIANLIFVVNKIDDVNMQDRAIALGRIENVLQKYVPNPTIYPLAAKPALKAKKVSDLQALQLTGFPEFETGLLDFLVKGRGGLLLKSKIQKGIDHLETIQSSINQRIGALDSEKGSVSEKLNVAQAKLHSQTQKRNDLEKQLQSKSTMILSQLKDVINTKYTYLGTNLKPSLQEEPSVDVLRGSILSFQRDCIEELQNTTETIYSTILNDYGANSLSIMATVKDMLSSLSRDASSSVQTIKVKERQVAVDSHGPDRSTRAALGGVVGAGAGLAIAGTATTVGVTTAGTIGTVAAFSTLGAIGVGVLTGGIGLLIGALVSGMLDDNNSSQNTSSYVEHETIVDNRRALKAIDRFLNTLNNNTSRIPNMIINSLLDELVKPIDQQITSQNSLIKQINNDLGQTIEVQQSTRDFLESKVNEERNIFASYRNILKIIENI